jgi:hypothetical protein
MAFANAFKDSTFEDVVFTDEKTVQNFSNAPLSIRCKRGEKCNDENIVYVHMERRCKVRI